MKKQDADILIEAALATGYKLSDYERMFVSGIRNRNFLTNKQGKVVENIYARATSGGIYQQKQKI